MATYYLAPTGNDTSGGGSYASPWKTAEKAYAMMSAGDTCIFKNGTYLLHQGQGIARKLGIEKANTTWKAETTGAVILRADWSPSLLTDDKPPNPEGCEANFGNMKLFMPSFRNYFLSGSFLIGVSAAGVRVEGLTIECIAGEGIMFGLGSDNCTIKDNSFYWTLGQAIVCYPGGNAAREADFSTGVVIEGNRSVFASTSRFDITYMCLNEKVQQGKAKDSASGAFRIGNVKSIQIKDNIIEYSFGEGLDVGRRPLGTPDAPCIVEGNVVHDCRHSQMYVTHGRHVHLRGNVSYAIEGIPFYTDLPSDGSGMAYNVSDENLEDFFNSSHVYYYNNLSVNTYRLMAMGPPEIRRTGQLVPREGMYIGFNTFVAGPGTRGTAWTIANGTDDGIIENNLTLYEDAPVDKLAVGSTGKMIIRRNAWTEQPPTAWRTTGTLVLPSAQMGLRNPRKVLRATGFDYYPTLAQYDAGYSNNFSADDYAITDDESPLRDTAGTRQALAGFWPPARAFTHDFYSAPRSSPGDMGATEYGGGNVGNKVTAAIGVSSASGPAPLTVTFSDESETEGAATINSWIWLFGDGTRAADAGPHTKTYTTPGTYTITLDVRATALGLGSVATQTVTVTQAAAVGQSFDAVRVALRTTTGSQAISFNLGGATPDLVLLFATNAITTATKTDGGLFCVGALTADGQWAAAAYATDNVGTTKTRRYFSNDCCLLTINDAGVTGKASKATFGPNTATLTVETAFPAGYLLTAVALADPGHEVAIGDFDTATALEVALGFAPDFMLAASTFQSTVDHLGNNGQLALTMLGDKQKVAGRWAGGDVAYHSSHNQADSAVKVSTANGELANVNTAKRLSFISQGGGVAIDRTVGSGLVGLGLYAAIKLGGRNQAVVYGKSPNTTGSVAYTTEVTAGVAGGVPFFETIQPALLFITAVPFDAGLSSWEYDAFTLAVVDSGATYGLLYGDRGEQATTDAWTRAENVLSIRDGAGNLKAAGTVTLTATGFSINWTTVNATDDYSFTAVALRKPPATGLPVAGFTWSSTPGDGTVEYTDASNPVGGAITSWLWDFGDGGTSDEQNPTYIYDESGTYTVSLTVTNAAGSNTVSRSVTVVVSVETFEYPVGPYDSMTVTNDSANQLHNDPSDPDYMRMEFALDLDALVFDATPADKTTARPGKVRIVADLGNNRLKVLYPNGTVKYITLGNS